MQQLRQTACTGISHVLPFWSNSHVIAFDLFLKLSQPKRAPAGIVRGAGTSDRTPRGGSSSETVHLGYFLRVPLALYDLAEGWGAKSLFFFFYKHQQSHTNEPN